ncbi:UDP-N-acetylmuramoyl-tripeptide--D-alanyl-D-alanine ligase [Anseongella ginsenosidimutans]|uniref:Alanine racemase n=1 Tax=Anseongella ginsenosidimutans TaxID=496056 RepID=A0A4R3KT57_9SPHI|nr:bifunctional UDP-N-acetylmuramoyl-tripeptide:D-alanyl-D-alanine ligase/alanine racemase [Anseongella ginsenosidimutans]QEC53163.1 bifunctional UDP-N-acetylmuramoyl-tripeptide:D-alanyl-D-alanine ligase/alanine racemase [Anseongella ginsenosidimutans]TCS87789.1 UDP-N-acetylmuramoyl-tripeptide--D-alanyl-D-alanine ligase [Anseongella ginsenosidimutans]
MYTIETIAAILSARPFIQKDEASILYLQTDSRRISFSEQSLFFAIKAARDGHDFIAEAWGKGVRNFVISSGDFPVENFPDSNFLLVPDTLASLQALAASHRRKFDYPLIGITGSNGKTVVKEWLFQLLSVDKNIVRSPKSFNSQTGVPLSLWRMGEEYELAIIEAGISKAGEMERLEKMIRPDIGILTNIGPAHDEGFGSLEEKITEKLKLFTHAFLFIYEKDALRSYEGALPGHAHFTWGYRGDEDLFISRVTPTGTGSILYGACKGQEMRIELPFADQASVHNGITCWCLLLWMEYPAEEISKRMRQLAPVSMRLKLMQAINHSSFINDSYNSDLGSLETALDFLARQQQHPRKTVILSDILQTGLDQEVLYGKVAALLGAAGINRLIAIGEALGRQRGQFSLPQMEFYDNTEEFTRDFRADMFGNEAILLKGARPFRFERISRLLEQKQHETVLEVNLNAMIGNLNFYKSKLAPGTGIMAMVKAFSYGSGSYEIAGMLQFHKVDYLAVAYTDEGAALRQNGIDMPVMVMSPEPPGFETLTGDGLEPEIYSFRVLEEFLRFLEGKEINSYPIHIKLDTGMHRLGFGEEDLEELGNMLKTADSIRVRSVFSHLAASEDPGQDEFSRQQMERFEEFAARLEKDLGYPFMRHLVNSAGILRFPEAHYDMVRLGIGLYGIGQGGSGSALQTVGTLKTTISQIRNVAAGETVGYGRTGRTDRPSRIATVKIGYADGFDRRLGNGNGEMLVNGQRVLVIGPVCMDMCMLDVTGVDCSETDEVIVFGEDLPIGEIAARLQTNAYEVLTNVSQRVKRIYTYE